MEGIFDSTICSTLPSQPPPLRGRSQYLNPWATFDGLPGLMRYVAFLGRISHMKSHVLHH